MKFAIGDRVVGVAFQDGQRIDGLHGTVYAIGLNDINLYGIRFDKFNRDFHELADLKKTGSSCELGHGWWVDSVKLKPGKISNWKNLIEL